MSTNDSCKRQIKITLKFWKSDGKIKIYCFSKTRRIIAKVKVDKFLKARLKVSYGRILTNTGKLENFTNSGTYFSKDELLMALYAFLERSTV